MKKMFLALAFLSPLAVLADGRLDSGMMGWGYGQGMMGGYGGFFMVAYSLIFLILGVLAIVWLWQHIDKK